MSRLRGWATVGIVSIVANTAWWAAARKFPHGPIGQLQSRIRNQTGASAS